MLTLTSKTPWRNRPSGLVALDWSNPITKGLTTSYLCGPIGQDRSLVAPYESLTLAAGSARGYDHISSAAGNTAPISHPRPSLTGCVGFTAAFRLRLPASFSGSAVNLFGKWDGGDGITQFFGRESSGGVQWYLTDTSAGSAAMFTAAFPGSSGPDGMLLVCVGTGSVLASYVNGITSGSTVGFSGPYIQAGTSAWEFGSARGTSATAEWLSVNYWNRALSESEIWSLYDPSTRWSLYQAITRKVYFDLGGGGGGSTFVPQVIMVM